MDAETVQSLRSELVEFLEIALHCIVFVRDIYPRAIFERRHKYGVVVWMSRYPDLNLYIHEVLKSTREMFLEDAIARVMLCTYGPDGRALDSFSFDIGSVNKMVSSLSTMEYVSDRLHDMFRTVLTRILFADAKVDPVPEDATFGVVLFTRDGHQQVLSNAVGGGEWVVAGPESFPSSVHGRIKTTPIYSSTAEDGIKLQLQLHCKEMTAT